MSTATAKLDEQVQAVGCLEHHQAWFEGWQHGIELPVPHAQVKYIQGLRGAETLVVWDAVRPVFVVEVVASNEEDVCPVSRGA